MEAPNAVVQAVLIVQNAHTGQFTKAPAPIRNGVDLDKCTRMLLDNGAGWVSTHDSLKLQLRGTLYIWTINYEGGKYVRSIC